jgi:hypothetical protein
MKKLGPARMAANAAMTALPAVLRDVMMTNFPPTKTRIKQSLKGIKKDQRGGLSIDQCVEAITRTWPLVAAAGIEKDRARNKGRRGGTGRKAVVLPRGTPVQRLAATRKSAVKWAAKCSLKWGATGGTEWDIRFGDPGYRCTTEKKWDVYAKSCSFPALADTHHITVSPDWRLRVRRVGDGDGMAGGYMILDARTVVELEHQRIHEVTYARQGRGYEVHVERGFASTWSDGTAHLYKTLDAAAKDPVPADLLPKHVHIEAQSIPDDDADAMGDLGF